MQRQQFAPTAFMRDMSPDQLATVRDVLAERSTADLQRKCAGLFAEPLLSDRLAAQLWVINEELCRRGVGPRWRGFGAFNPQAAPKYGEITWPARLGPAPLGDPMRRKLLIRWCDASWLRRELGPSHIPRAPTWRPLFLTATCGDELEAMYARLAECEEPNHEVVRQLNVPPKLALALRGFVAAGAADRHSAVRRRLKDKIGPALDALAHRPRYALTPEQIAKRRVYAEAIELADGSTTDAARIVRWISGEQVSPQAVDKMRAKIAADAGLMGKKWHAAAG